MIIDAFHLYLKMNKALRTFHYESFVSGQRKFKLERKSYNKDIFVYASTQSAHGRRKYIRHMLRSKL